jgi:predicted metal-dependent phosphoesterase TrpH
VIDLHVHSAASDGEHAPEEVVRRAAAVGLTVIALTDHDTLDGVAEAVHAGARHGVRVIGGCEFSVQAPWGEMHLLGYFLPAGDGPVEAFLEHQRNHRKERAARIVERLNGLGVELGAGDVLDAAGGGAVGRPHVARALVAQGAVRDVQEAFRRYLGAGRPAYVEKTLASTTEVAALVRAARGVTSAAHLKNRGTREALAALRRAGVDGVEIRHPAHDDTTARRLTRFADEIGALRTGGSDWHGVSLTSPDRAGLGDVTVPEEWLLALEALHGERTMSED